MIRGLLVILGLAVIGAAAIFLFVAGAVNAWADIWAGHEPGSRKWDGSPK